ncbi:MAG TPA: hypothetical protein VIL49_06285, partial [Capillimicrobium sp.]
MSRPAGRYDPRRPRIPEGTRPQPLDESLLDEDWRLQVRNLRLEGGSLPAAELDGGGLEDTVLDRCSLS